MQIIGNFTCYQNDEIKLCKKESRQGSSVNSIGKNVLLKGHGQMDE